MEENKEPSYHLEDTEDFGLQQSEYEPLEREEGNMPPTFEDPVYHEQEEEEESNHEGAIIAAIIGFLVLVGVAVYLFGFGGKEQVAGWFGDEPTEQPTLTTTDEPAKTEAEPVPEMTYEEPEPAAEAIEEEVISETPSAMGDYSSIEAITAPTGRSYIVIGSFVDADLARDLGEQLMADGTGIRILSPTDRAPLLHRVAVAEFDTFGEALTQVEEYTLTYEGAWVLKY